MGRQILQLNQKIQVTDGSDMATVISSMINSQIAGGENVERRRRRLRFNKQNAATGATSQPTTASNPDYDEHLKIDRILYNFFGDMMSIARTTQIDFQTFSNGDDNEKCDAQNEAVENFIPQFIHEQSAEFIEALINLNLLAEMSTPSVEQIANDVNHGNSDAASDDQNVRENNLPTVENAVAVNDGDNGTNVSDKSSVYSIQHFSPIILNDDEIIEQTPTPNRLHMDANAAQNYARNNGSNGSSSGRRSVSHSPSPSWAAQSSKSSTRDPPSFGHISSQSSAQSTGRIASNFTASQNHIVPNDPVFGGPTQNFEFADSNIGGRGNSTSMAASQNTFGGFEKFSQGFQSLKNDFHSESWSFAKCSQGFSNNFFASEQQNNDDNGHDDDYDGFEFDDKNNDNDDFDHFLTGSFASGSFNSSQRKRPNATSSRLSANFAINSNSGNFLRNSILPINF